MERYVGAGGGLLVVALIYLLSLLPGGWFLAAGVVGIGGMAVGARMRRLRRAAERDELTGLYNRRHFEEVLHAEFERAVRFQRPLSLLFLDLDDFGKLNKRLGHLAGDAALRMVARQVRQAVRQVDLVCRWGGEEFVVILPETTAGQAGVIAERIRAQVERSQVRDQEHQIWVTVSAGVATYPGTAKSAEDLLRQAIAGQSVAKGQKNAVEVIC